LSDQMS